MADPFSRVLTTVAPEGRPGRARGFVSATNCVDITHVEDVAGCVANVAERLSAGSSLKPLHLITGQGITLSDLAQTVVRLTGSTSEIVTVAPRDFDVARFIGDPGFATALNGWRASFGTPSEMASDTGRMARRAVGQIGVKRRGCDADQRAAF